MRTKLEGYNTFSNYDQIQIAIDFTNRSHKTKSLQIIFGGESIFNPDTVKSDNRGFKYKLKKFFYDHSKDGYYKEKFLFIDGSTERMESKGRGLIFHEVFFFLEEEYDKLFVIDYFKGLFDELNEIYRTEDRIQFRKYKRLKKDRCV